ncbi:tetratricopeptide repeat protein [Zhouia sp. PK063]|uniref:tetratricopeptide repeat protein n=1 Tax=Zhouia sp. PK063 TaxID=3373602 RepID=UPI0037A0D203
MQKTTFTSLLAQPEKITHQDLFGVQSVVEEFPYFQAAHALYLKGLKLENSIKYNNQLKITAAYTADRAILFDLITSEVFMQNKIAETIKKLDSENQDKEIEHIELDHSKVLDDDLFQAKESEEETIQEVTQQLQIGKPLNFNKAENHSFNEWLKLSSYKPIIRDKKEETPSKKPKKNIEHKFKLIDDFIAANPKIAPPKEHHSTTNLAKVHETEKSELMTETLARVYLEQKKYKKAIQAYNILILKYPEKSGFFADQIKAVQKLQQNN